MLNEPILNYDFPLAEAAAQGAWQQASRYSLWIGHQRAGDPPYQVLERYGDTLLRLPLRGRLMRLIPAGTPFRIAHLFAPFRQSDADMIYIRAALDEGVYHTLIAATSRAVKEDHLVWFCRECGTELERQRCATGSEGLNAFWPFLLDAVRQWNATPERQSCKACGAPQPLAYGFDAALDRPEEAAARAEA